MSAEAWVSANDETGLATDVPLYLAELKRWFDLSLKKLRGRATQDRGTARRVFTPSLLLTKE
jgi:hypothetical protein